jgi:hypothetical protein
MEAVKLVTSSSVGEISFWNSRADKMFTVF